MTSKINYVPKKHANTLVVGDLKIGDFCRPQFLINEVYDDLIQVGWRAYKINDLLLIIDRRQTLFTATYYGPDASTKTEIARWYRGNE